MTTYTYDAADALVTATGPGGAIVTYSSDADGNRTARQDGGGTATYAWSPRDRLLGITEPSGAILTNTYRPDGLRHGRQDASGTQTFTYDGSQILFAEGDGPQLFVHGPKLIRAVGPALDRTYHPDALGNILALSAGEASRCAE